MLGVAMITVDRSPQPNFLGQTLANLRRSDPILGGGLVLCDSGADPEWIIREAESTCDGLMGVDVISAPAGGRCASHNVATALRAASRRSLSGWVLFLEDDIDVVADFFGSTEAWLRVNSRRDRHIYPLGSAYPQVFAASETGERYWDYPIGEFYGTQAVAMRDSVALDLAEYLEAHAYDRQKDGTEYDLLMSDWSRATHPEVECFRTPVPSFVQHIGRTSIIRARENVHTFPTWPGREWAYRSGVVFHRSQRVRGEDFDAEWFRQRRGELGHPPGMIRKVWEHAAIAQVYVDRCNGSSRALGFGVGKEPLPAWFAHRKAAVIATDQDAKSAADWRSSQPWAKDGQHAADKSELTRGSVCSEEEFTRIEYRAVDMNAIPDDLRRGQFDFTWSAGSFEHIGGIDQGIDFFCQQMECLRPGGVAAHTTEFNYGSDDETLQAENLVFFRRRDLAYLAERLEAQGDELLSLDVTPGDREIDSYVAEEPYRPAHLNLRLDGHVTTSVLLVAKRGSTSVARGSE